MLGPFEIRAEFQSVVKIVRRNFTQILRENGVAYRQSGFAEDGGDHLPHGSFVLDPWQPGQGFEILRTPRQTLGDARVSEQTSNNQRGKKTFHRYPCSWV